MKKLILAFTCLFLAVPSLANPIPIPPPASMPLEDMHIVIQPCGDALHATFTGDYTFVHILIDVFSMLFPLPPDANNIRVWQDDIELPWSWSGERYPTILPEMPTILMIEWLGPFPEFAVFRVDYEHDLIKRPEEFIFFYAVGTGKYFPTYEKTTTAYFDILLPAGFAVAGVWLDDTAHEYNVVDGHLYVTVQSYFGPIVNDLIVSLVQTSIYVATDGNDTTGDGSPENPFATIQKGIDSALDGHTVIVQPGTYKGAGNRDIDFKGKAITVQSANGPENCIIDCENLWHRGFYFHSGEDTNSIISGFTIKRGNAKTGGGIYCSGSSPTIENCAIINNSAYSWEYPCGGGIYCKSNSSPAIINCIIRNNISQGADGSDWGMDGGDGYGGGIYSSVNCHPTIENCIIAYNQCRGGNAFPGGLDIGPNGGNAYGGGIYGSNMIVKNCVIANNTTSGGDGTVGTLGAGNGGYAYGGAVYCDYNSELMIKNCTISGNKVSGGEGGDSPPFVPPSGEGGNGYGGAIYCYGNDELMMENCTIADNTASGGDGGFTGFPGQGYAGILYSMDSTTTITNSIIWDGVFLGPQIFLDSSGQSYSVIAVYSSDVQGGQAQIQPVGTCFIIWGPSNIDADPCFADMSNGEYHLQSEAGRWDPNSQNWVTDANTSPCIDAGDPNLDWTSELWPHGKRINIGAYGGTPQASMSLSDVGNIADLNNDDFVDYNDLRLYTEKWLNQQVLLKEDLDRNGAVDFIDFAIFAENWLHNKAPVADAGPDITVFADGEGASCCVCLDIRPVGLVMMDGSDSYDPDGDTLTFTWEAPIPWLLYGIGCYDGVIEAANPTGEFPVGSTTVSLTVSDGELIDTDSLVVSILLP